MIVMITNTIPPYCYDIPHIIGLPINFSHRFRHLTDYDKKGTDLFFIGAGPELRSKINQSPFFRGIKKGDSNRFLKPEKGDSPRVADGDEDGKS